MTDAALSFEQSSPRLRGMDCLFDLITTARSLECEVFPVVFTGELPTSSRTSKAHSSDSSEEYDFISSW